MRLPRRTRSCCSSPPSATTPQRNHGGVAGLDGPEQVRIRAQSAGGSSVVPSFRPSEADTAQPLELLGIDRGWRSRGPGEHPPPACAAPRWPRRPGLARRRPTPATRMAAKPAPPWRKPLAHHLTGGIEKADPMLLGTPPRCQQTTVPSTMILAFQDDTSHHDAGRSPYGRWKARFLLGLHRGQLVRAHVPLLCPRHGWTAGCSQLARLATAPAATDTWRVQGGRPRTASAGQGGGVDRPLEEASVGQANTIDWTTEAGFQAHGADASGRCSASAWCGRSCSSSSPPSPLHGGEWRLAPGRITGRELASWGTVRLIPPAYVKPSVKRQKNDRADAEVDLRSGAAAEPALRELPAVSLDTVLSREAGGQTAWTVMERR